MRIGILGAARIAPPAMIAPARATGVAQVVAVASRDRARGEAFAAAHDIGAVFDDYEALIADPGVEAIYNALPPARHADLTIRALAAGKPVLCEKPFCMTAAEAQAMVAAGEASGTLVMEAFHYRYHPLFARVLEIVRGGAIGRVQRIEAVFNITLPNENGEIRYRPDLGGGALMDLGTYCLHWCRTVAGEEPTVTKAQARIGPTGVDLATQATLAFPSGAVAEVGCDMTAPVRATLEIEGSAGTLKAINPLAPQLGHLIELNGVGETVTTEPTYNFQLRAFVDAVRGGTAPVTSGEDSVAQMRLIDAVRAMSRQAQTPRP